MMLTIHGLPMATKYQDIKALLKRQCNMSEFILDCLMGEGDGTKKVRIGVTDDREGAHLMKSLNGFRYSGNVLQVVPVGKAPVNIDAPQQNYDQRSYAPHNDFATQGTDYNQPIDQSRREPWGQGGQSTQWGSNQPPMNQPTMGQSSYNYQQTGIILDQTYPTQVPIQRPEVAPYDRQGYPQDRQTYPATRAPVNQQYSQSYPTNVNVPVNTMAQRADRSSRSHVLRSVEVLEEPLRHADQPYHQTQGAMSKDISGAAYAAAAPHAQATPWAQDSTKPYDRNYIEPDNRSGILKPSVPPYNRGDQSFSRDDPMKPSPRFSPTRDVAKTLHTPRFSPRRDMPPQIESHISRFPPANREIKDDRLDRGAKEGHVPRFSPRREVHRFSPRRDMEKDQPRFSPRRDVPKDGHRFSPRRDLSNEGPRFSPRRDILKEGPRFSPRRDLSKEGPRFSPRRDVGKMVPRFSPRRDGPKENIGPRFSPRRDELKDTRGPRLSPRREKVGMSSGRISPGPHDSHKRSRYSPSLRDDKQDKYMPEEPTRPHKDIRPAYEPNTQAPSQAMYSGGYRPSVHETLQYPAAGMRQPERSLPWQQEKSFTEKEESRRETARMPKFEPREVTETKRSRSPVRKSRSPLRRDRSPVRDRFKKHSPSPRSPRRSWALEKRRSPDIRDAPPPPMWHDNREDDFKRPFPDSEDEKPKRMPVWEPPCDDSTDRHRRVEEDRRISDPIRVRMDLHAPNQPSPTRRDSPHQFKQDERAPKFEPRESRFDIRDHKFEPREPKFEPRDPKFEPRDPKFDARDPKFDQRQPKFEPRETEFDRRHPTFEPREPKFEPRETKFESRGHKHHESKFEPREPKFEPRETKFELREPKFVPTFEPREPKFEHREPKFGSREHKFESREPKFEPRESPREPKFDPREDFHERRGDFRRDERPPSREFRDVTRPERTDRRAEPEHRDRREERKEIPIIHEKFDKELDDIYKRAKEFNKRAQELRKREELAEQRNLRDSKERHRDSRDDVEFQRHDSRRVDDSRRHRDEVKSSDLDWKLDDDRSHTMSPNVRAKRDKAVEELANKIIDKHGKHFPTELRKRVFEELKISLVKMLKDMYGNQDVSFIEMVVKFNAKYNAKDELRILNDVISSLPSHYRSMKRAAEDAANTPVPAKAPRLSDSAAVNMDVAQNLVQAQIAEWNMNMQAAMMGFQQSFDMMPQVAQMPPPQLIIPNPIVEPLMVQHPFTTPAKDVPTVSKEQPVFQQTFQPVPPVQQSQSQQSMLEKDNYTKQKQEGHHLYLCKDDFEPFSENQAEHLKRFLVSQLIKASESGLGWTPDFTVKGLQSQFRYELLTKDEDTKNWIVSLDFNEFPLFNVLVYTKEELWYERAAIWLPGHSRCRNIEPLAKLKLQNRKLHGVNIEKWKLVKKIVNLKGTRVYVDMPPSSARALEKHKMMLSYELQKVNVFLKAVAIDKDAFDSGLKEMSVKDQAELIAAVQNSPMPSLNHDPNIVKIALKGNKMLSLVQARKVKEMVIYHIFKYQENVGHSRTDFVKFGYVLPGHFGVLPENNDSRRWLMSLDIGKVNRHVVVVLGADEAKTKYIRMTLYLSDSCMRSVNNMPLVFERVKQSNQGVKGLNFHLWKAVRIRNERRCSKFEIDMDVESVETIINLKYQLDYVDHRQRQETIDVKYEDSRTKLEDKIKRYKAEQVDSYDVANMELASSDEDEDVIFMDENRKHFRVLESRPVRSEFRHAATASKLPNRVVRKSVTRTVRKVPETDKQAAMSKQLKSINMEERLKAVADIEDDKWGAQEIDENAPTDLDKVTQRALETEVKQIFDKAMEVFPDKPSCEEDKVVVTRFRSDAGYRLAKAIAGNVAQRLLDIHNPLLVKLSFKSKPNPELFKAFLKRHRCCAIKRTHTREFVFAARMKTAQDFDNICALAFAQCGNTLVTIKPAYNFTQAPPRLKYVFTRDCLSKKGNSQNVEITKKEKSNDDKSQETVKMVTEKVSEVKQITKEGNKADKPEQTVKIETKNITTPVKEEKMVTKENEKAKTSPNVVEIKSESVKEANKTIVAKTQKSESDTTKTVQKTNETKPPAKQNVNKNESDNKSVDTTTDEREITTVKIVVNIKPSTDKTKKGNEVANKKAIEAPKTVEKEEKSSIDAKTEKPKGSETVTDKSKQSNNTVKAANADSKEVKETVTAQNIKSETVQVETPNSKPAEKPVANPKTPVKKPTEKTVTKPQTPVKVTPTKTGVTTPTIGVKKQQVTTKTAQSKIKSPKIYAKKVNLKTASKFGDVNDKELSDNDELDDYDILAMMSEAIILDECGSDEE